MTHEERRGILSSPPRRRDQRGGGSKVVIVLLVLACLLGVGNGVMNAINIGRIQQSREDSIRSQCAELNERHDQTISALDAEIAKLRRTDPARAARAEAGRVGTVRLIEALAPRRDCERRVQQFTK